MKNWKWVDRQVLLLLHEESLADHGGAMGLRDAGLLESALARPVNLALYEEPDVARPAASYGAGLSKNHPFMDGNKRAAFLSVGLFLALNGFRLHATQAEATLVVLALASGELDEPAFAQWIRAHIKHR